MNDMVPPPGSDYYSTVYEITDKNISFIGNWQPESFVYEDDGYSDWYSVEWSSTNSEQELSLSGNGAFGVINDSWYTGMVSIDVSGPGTFTIGSGVDLRGAYLCARNGSHVNVEGRISGIVTELEVGNGTLDLSKATITADYVSWGINSGGTMRVANMAINSRSCLQVEGGYGLVDSAVVYLDGDMTLAGTSFNIKSESRYTWETDPRGGGGKMGYIEIFGDQTTVSVSGSITISGRTSIFYCGCGSYEENGVSIDPYGDPDPSTPLFICSSINESNLKLLEPYAVKEEYIYGSAEEYIWYKPLSDREYYAVSGYDGMTYVYLCPAGTPPPPPNAIVVQDGEELQLGADADSTPSAEKPVAIMPGGVVDAGNLTDDTLLNNQLIVGTGGTLKTTDTQQVTLTGSGSVNYSIEAADNSATAAALRIGTAGETSQLKLNGASYDSADVQVKGGVVTISGNTSVGVLDANTASSLEIDSGAKLTNYGEVKADVTTAGNTSILNENVMKGDVELAETAVLTNNGSIEGKVSVAGKVYGSGTFNETELAATALMHVGNSPGYQKHTSLDINRGATLSFTVDGTTPATATNHGSGTYSVLEADNITINPGTGKVNVEVEVTSGIVGAGTAPFEVTLIQAGTTNAVADDFTINIEDNGWLEEGAEVIWDAAAGTMILSGSVNEQVLAAMMDSNAGNVASTMWASANVVQELARTAENQFLVGMPGQTTFWGAAIGTFMDVGGDYGFRYNAGGYAVGVQHAFTESFRAGFAFGQTYGDFTSDDEQLKVDQKSLIPALTAQYVCKTGKMSTMTVSGHVAYGTVENTGDFYQTGNSGKAEWDDTVLNVGIRAAWNVELSEETAVSLFTGLTYQEVEQDSFTEKSTMGDRRYSGGSMSSLSLPLGITWRGVYQMDGTNVFAPEVTVAYVADVSRDDPKVNTSMFGFRGYGEGADIGRSAFMLSVGGNWMFNSSWSVGAFYTMEARSNQLNQSLNAALRYSF